MGAAHPAGPRQIDTLILAVLARRDGIWRIQAAENVTLVHPRSGAVILREKQAGARNLAADNSSRNPAIELVQCDGPTCQPTAPR